MKNALKAYYKSVQHGSPIQFDHPIHAYSADKIHPALLPDSKNLFHN